jgi:hypothetical protein
MLIQIEIGRAARRVRDSFMKGEVSLHCPHGDIFVFARNTNQAAFDPRDKVAITELKAEVSELKESLAESERRLRDIGGNVVPMKASCT